MAKPGSNEARRFARGAAVDLSAAKMTDEQLDAAQEVLELQQGLRCSGCGRRIAIGLQFTSIGLREQEPVVKLAACSRQDCDFALQARDGATYMEMVEYSWLDELGADAPPARAIVARNAKRAERAAEVAGEASGDASAGDAETPPAPSG